MARSLGMKAAVTSSLLFLFLISLTVSISTLDLDDHSRSLPRVRSRRSICQGKDCRSRHKRSESSSVRHTAKVHTHSKRGCRPKWSGTGGAGTQDISTVKRLEAVNKALDEQHSFIEEIKWTKAALEETPSVVNVTQGPILKPVSTSAQDTSDLQASSEQNSTEKRLAAERENQAREKEEADEQQKQKAAADEQQKQKAAADEKQKEKEAADEDQKKKEEEQQKEDQKKQEAEEKAKQTEAEQEKAKEADEKAKEVAKEASIERTKPTRVLQSSSSTGSSSSSTSNSKSQHSSDSSQFASFEKYQHGNHEGESDSARWVAFHNSVRSKYFTPPVSWSDTLAGVAKKVSETCVFEHSHGVYGENIAAGESDLEQVVKDWAFGQDESSVYDPQNPIYSHFTQIVWKGTTQIGCAFTDCGNIQDVPWTGDSKFWVCEYFPPGNYAGEFIANVNAAKGGAPLKR